MSLKLRPCRRWLCWRCRALRVFLGGLLLLVLPSLGWAQDGGGRPPPAPGVPAIFPWEVLGIVLLAALILVIVYFTRRR